MSQSWGIAIVTNVTAHNHDTADTIYEAMDNARCYAAQHETRGEVIEEVDIWLNPASCSSSGSAGDSCQREARRRADAQLREG